MKRLLFLAIILQSFLATAATTLVSYSSDYETITQNGNTLTIYAGMTDQTKTSCASTGTCNTCALDTSTISGTSVCGIKEVVPANSISFVIKSDSTTLNSSSVAKIINTSNGNAPVNATSYSSYATNTELTVTLTWADLCAAFSGGSASCTKSTTQTFNIGYNDGGSTLTEYITVQINFRYVLSTASAFQSFNCASPVVTGAGFCYFDLYPGDNKAYVVPTFNPNNITGLVTDLSSVSTGTTDPSGIKYKYLRMLYVQGNSANDFPAVADPRFTQSMSAVNLNYDPSTGVVSPKKIANLINGNTYLFMSASVDQAGLVTNYSDPSQQCQVVPTFCPNCGDASLYATKETQCVTPQKVNGLLDGQNCFIATATYGSIMAPEVESFRKFRGQYLLKSEFGKNFVRTYYKYSPALANVIQNSEVLKAFSRTALFPLLVFVKMSLSLGLWTTFLIVLAVFIFLSALILKPRKPA